MPEDTRLADVVAPVNEKIGSNKDPNLPYVGLEHLPSRGSALLGTEPATASISTNSVFQRGDVLFGKLRPNLRKALSAPFDGYCSTDILVLRAKDGVNARFAGWLFRSENVGAAAERTAIGTKMPRTSWGLLKDEKVFVPPYPEQGLIARILDTLDTQIRRTEVLIAKLEQIKQGMLTDLLTRGIDEDGQLRPPPEEAPHLYKDSPLGWIPKNWRISQLGAIVESAVDGPFGSNLKTEHYVEHPGVRVVRLQNVRLGWYDDTDRAFITASHATKLARNEVLPGDLLVAGLGEETHPLGRACLYPSSLPPAVNKADCYRLQSVSRIAYNAYIMHFLNSAAAAEQVRRSQQGVTLQRINLTNLRALSIPIMSLGEQERICGALSAASRKVGLAEQEQEKLREQKAGLTDDLLTGRVRVTPLLG